MGAGRTAQRTSWFRGAGLLRGHGRGHVHPFVQQVKNTLIHGGVELPSEVLPGGKHWLKIRHRQYLRVPRALAAEANEALVVPEDVQLRIIQQDRGDERLLGDPRPPVVPDIAGVAPDESIKESDALRGKREPRRTAVTAELRREWRAKAPEPELHTGRPERSLYGEQGLSVTKVARGLGNHPFG